MTGEWLIQLNGLHEIGTVLKGRLRPDYNYENNNHPFYRALVSVFKDALGDKKIKGKHVER